MIFMITSIYQLNRIEYRGGFNISTDFFCCEASDYKYNIEQL